MQIYKCSRPELTIENLETVKLGNCYHSYKTKVTSRWRLNCDQIFALRKAGLITDGQYFAIESQCDGNEDPAGFDENPCVDTETQMIANGRDGKPLPPSKSPYWEYIVETRVDSGD